MVITLSNAKFTPEMKATHTILIPDMLPIHFGLIMEIFRQNGYKMELLRTATRNVVDEGLKNVHNDTCYPALLVIGQFMDALKSGRYDPDKTALLISQTGGGCRASNYIHLLRKALDKDYPQIPVLSINFSGLEKDSGFRITIPMFYRMLYAVLYGDMLMSLYNQCRAYEVNKGDSQKF
jgi:predicted nucleotide-binding protein (sugar kinase/HSP70/actin superfamily)